MATETKKMMGFKLIAITYVIYILTGCASYSVMGEADPQYQCNLLDPDLIYCPIVQAPSITELRVGFVVLIFTVQPDGSVSGMTLL